MKYSMDEWWASMTVTQKERIASKVAKETVKYPQCTLLWSSLDEERKKRIHDHCTDAHGLIKPEWSEGDTYSY